MDNNINPFYKEERPKLNIKILGMIFFSAILIISLALYIGVNKDKIFNYLSNNYATSNIPTNVLATLDPKGGVMKKGLTFTYKISAIINNNETALSNPSNSITTTTDESAINLTWDQVPNAVKYVIYRSENGKDYAKYISVIHNKYVDKLSPNTGEGIGLTITTAPVDPLLKGTKQKDPSSTASITLTDSPTPIGKGSGGTITETPSIATTTDTPSTTITPTSPNILPNTGNSNGILATLILSLTLIIGGIFLFIKEEK